MKYLQLNGKVVGSIHDLDEFAFEAWERQTLSDDYQYINWQPSKYSFFTWWVDVKEGLCWED